MCSASGGNAVCSCIPAAMVPPRLTPSASRVTAAPTAWFDIMSPTTAMAPSTGTPLFSMVPSVRAKRAVSILSARRPASGSRRIVWSHARRPCGVLVHTRQARTPAVIRIAPTHQ
jgi:hypothetical protein